VTILPRRQAHTPADLARTSGSSDWAVVRPYRVFGASCGRTRTADRMRAVLRLVTRALGPVAGLGDVRASGSPAGTVALVDRGGRETGEVTSSGSVSVFAGFRFPPKVISVAVRWYLRYGLSYRDVEELLAERAVTVDHVTSYRWVQRFTPEFIEAARPCLCRAKTRTRVLSWCFCDC
jgi:hypothetical protein